MLALLCGASCLTCDSYVRFMSTVDELIETIMADDQELDELEFSDPDWHLSEEQAVL
jgi:hypothetical protein